MLEKSLQDLSFEFLMGGAADYFGTHIDSEIVDYRLVQMRLHRFSQEIMIMLIATASTMVQ